MGAISTSIEMHDGFSKVLKAFKSGLESVESSLSDVQKKLNKPFDMSVFVDMKNELVRVNASLDKMGKEALEAANAQDRITASTKKSAGAVSSLTSSIKGLVAAYAGIEGAKATLNAADNYANITSRLNLMYDGKTDTAELENYIRDMSNRTRADFSTTADAISKIGIQAPEAFNNAKDVVNFMEQINKHIIVAGVNTQTAENAMIQLTQALGSGLLRGEELRSIMEGMPSVAKAIEKYFHEVKGDTRNIKEIAEDNLITSKIVKDAMYAYADKINEKFDKMKYRFSDLWTLFKNSANKALVPVYNKLTELSNSMSFRKFAVGAGAAIGLIAKALAPVCNTIKEIYNFVVNNWSFIAPVIGGIVSALAIYKLWLGYVKVAELVSAGAKLISCLASYALAAATKKQASATAIATAQQWGLNAALLASPWTWVIIAIIAVIVVLYLAVAAYNKLTDSSVSATGIIAGSVLWLAGVIHNTIAGLWNALLAIADSIANLFIGVAEIVYNAFNDGFTGWIGGVKSALWSFINWALQLVKPLIEVWDKLKGTNYASSLQTKVNAKIAEGQTSNYKKFDRNLSSSKLSMNYVDPNALYSKGYNWGEGLANKVSDFFTGENISKEIAKSLGLDSFDDLMKSTSPTLDDVKNNATNPALRGTEGGYGDVLNKIADNTGKMADADKDRELEIMRELGTREAVNKFTTAQIKVMQNNSVSANKSSDVDSIIARLAQGLRDALNSTAEGAY